MRQVLLLCYFYWTLLILIPVFHYSLFQVNFFAPLRLLQLCLPHLKGGHVLFMGSGIVDHPDQGVLSYGASKIALEYAMKCFAAESNSAKLAIHTCVVYPGLVKTDMLKTYLAHGKDCFSPEHHQWLKESLSWEEGSSKLTPSLLAVAHKIAHLLLTGITVSQHGQVLFWHALS
jgi:NAD(P)-dependent dehydrogenase (short-subunit alcohol dehydrogenase family)